MSLPKFGDRFRWKGGTDDRPFDRLPMIHCGPFGEDGRPYVSGDRWWMFSMPNAFSLAPVYANEANIEIVPVGK